MMIIGVDYHRVITTSRLQIQKQVSAANGDLNHSDGEAEKFYRDVRQRGVSVRVGMEATGYSRWFERLLAELGIEVWDRRCRGDQDQASPQAEGRPPRRPTAVEAAARK